VLQATDDAGAEVVYDLTGGAVVEGSWRCTAREGRYLATGFADDDDNGMTGRPLRMACIGNISIVGVMLAWAEEVDPGMRRFGFNPFGRDVADEVHDDLLRMVAEGKIRPAVGRRVTMAEAGAALDDHEQRRSIGRTVVLVGDAATVEA
jgi:NADPH2:quinone reductase